MIENPIQRSVFKVSKISQRVIVKFHTKGALNFGLSSLLSHFPKLMWKTCVNPPNELKSTSPTLQVFKLWFQLNYKAFSINPNPKVQFLFHRKNKASIQSSRKKKFRHQEFPTQKAINFKVCFEHNSFFSFSLYFLHKFHLHYSHNNRHEDSCIREMKHRDS